jgi:putative hemolysin
LNQIFLILPVLATVSPITFSTPTLGGIVAVVIAMLLLVVSGFVSASEIAFFSLSPTDMSHIEEHHSRTDKTILKLKANSERLLATILISNNFVNVAIVMLLNFFFLQVIHFGDSELLQFLFMTVILTFLLLLFGEVMPKIYSAQHALSFCHTAAPGINFLQKLFYPLSSILVHSRILATKIVQKEPEPISVDDLEQALKLTDKNEISEERNMLKGIIRFGDETAKEVMTPRLDMIDLDIQSSYTEVLECIVKNNYSRIPVYAGSEDNIKGVLYIKDLLPHLGKPANFRWQSLIRPPYFVPDTKMIDDLLREFQTNKVHIAIVVDEFGGTSGLVTLEDILEEIVGEINDEYDEEEHPYVKLNQNSFIFEAKILLSDFYKVLKIDEDIFTPVSGDADTLAGLLLELKGDFPKVHETIDYQNFHFEVLEVSERRIVSVKVVIRKKESTETENKKADTDNKTEKEKEEPNASATSSTGK